MTLSISKALFASAIVEAIAFAIRATDVKISLVWDNEPNMMASVAKS
jgi:hypothetical protein